MMMLAAGGSGSPPRSQGEVLTPRDNMSPRLRNKKRWLLGKGKPINQEEPQRTAADRFSMTMASAGSDVQ